MASGLALDVCRREVRCVVTSTGTVRERERVGESETPKSALHKIGPQARQAKPHMVGPRAILLHEVRRVLAKTCEVQMTREQHQWRDSNRNTTTSGTTGTASTKLHPHLIRSASHAIFLSLSSLTFKSFPHHFNWIPFLFRGTRKTVEKTAPSCCSKRRAPAASAKSTSHRHTIDWRTSTKGPIIFS
jgi:hypothetical protein